MDEMEMSIHDILKKYWGYAEFRPLQEDIIRSVIDGKDTLALLPTGGGKSICFQVPGLYKPGICIVISPLIALMKDQVENLRRKGIAAETIYSGMTARQVDTVLDNCIYGKVKFLYVSPERLQTDIFIERLTRMNVNLLAIDESHCISQWGYDFRPPYLNIVEIRQYLPNAPVLALTATATEVVVDDIQERLGFPEKNVFRKSFARPNVIYVVQKEEDRLAKTAALLKKVNASSVVYVRNRKRTKLIAEYLEDQGVSASFYHAGLDADVRSERQEAWIKNRFKTIVATNAFGMGIDKPDVRLVIHLDIPDSLEAYFQEAGRGGRDEKKANAILYYTEEDIDNLIDNFEESFPDLSRIKKVYESLGNYCGLAVGSGENQTFSLNIGKFTHNFQIEAKEFFHAVKFLSREGYLTMTDISSSFSSVWIDKEDIPMRSLSELEQKVIVTILRMYEGVFDQFTRIHERVIALKAESNEAEVIQVLKQLHKNDILKYSEKKQGLSIIWMQDRVPIEYFKISKEIYANRKKVAKEKLQAVIDFVQRNDKCRSRILLEYFGEKDGKNCGACDVCIQQSKNKDMYALQIVEALKKLSVQDISIEELLEQIPLLKEYGELLEWCVDQEYIEMHSNHRVKILNKN